MAPAATQRAREVALRWMSGVLKRKENGEQPAIACAHSTPEEADLTPRQQTAFAAQCPRQ